MDKEGKKKKKKRNICYLIEKKKTFLNSLNSYTIISNYLFFQRHDFQFSFSQ